MGLIRVGEQELTGEDEAEVDAYFAPDFALHGPDGAEMDYEALKGYSASLRAAFDDLTISRGIMVVEGNYVACQKTITGTFVREFTRSPVGSLPPNGRRIVFDLMNIFRYDDQGRFAEEWLQTDNRSRLRESGADQAIHEVSKTILRPTRPLRLRVPRVPRSGDEQTAVTLRVIGYLGGDVRPAQQVDVPDAGAVVRRSSRSTAKLLLVYHPPQHGRHPGALIEPERAGVAGCIDAEPDALLAALPEAPERLAEKRRADAPPAPRSAGEEHVDPPAAVRFARADRPGGDLLPGADNAPQCRVKALASDVVLRPRLEVARPVLPVVRERLLVRGVELDRVTLRVERKDAQPVRPLGYGWPRLELDAQLAKDAHGAVAKRFEQPASGTISLQHGVLDPACAALDSVLLERGRDQRPDPQPERDGVDVSLGAHQLASFGHDAVADDPIAVADDPRVLPEVELRPLFLQIGLRERALAVK